MLQNFQNKRVVIMGLGLYKEGSGVMAAQFFAKREAQVLATDLRNAKILAPTLKRLKKFKNIQYVLGRHRPQDFRKADIIFQNPSVPDDSPYLKIAKKFGAAIVNDWTIFLSLHQPKIFIGVTGTRGKSTTTALIYEIFKRCRSPIRAKRRTERRSEKVWLAGNLGVSPLSFIDAYQGEPMVAELSSWLLRGFKPIKKSPSIAIITNIMRDHLDKYPSMREYIADKSLIYKFQTSEDFVILNRDNAIIRRLARDATAQRFWFSKKEFKQGDGCFVRFPPRLKKIYRSTKTTFTSILASMEVNAQIVFRREGREKVICKVRDIKLHGIHNLENVLAAVCTACVYGMPVKIIRQVIKNFHGLPDRLELVREWRGVKYYNDTTATTPEATIAALATLGQLKCKMQNAKCKNPPHPVLGSAVWRHRLARLGGSEPSSWLLAPSRPLSPLGRGLRRGETKSKNIVLICGGADKKLEFKELAKSIKRYCKAVVLLPGTATKKIKLPVTGYSLLVTTVKSMKEAVKTASTLAIKGDIVLLSPGAASFGLFKNEFDRGGQFVRIVNGLKS